MTDLLTTKMPDIIVPSKYDIIPLHTSDRATFKDCRRRWAWSSPAQSNLVPKTSVHGVYMPFHFGTGIHYALQHFYNPVLKEDPEVTFDTWWNLQWNGGEIHEDELDQFADRNPQFSTSSQTWSIEGLVDLLPVPDYDNFEMHHQLGMGMMRFYKEYAEQEDDFVVVATEHLFSVPVLDPHTNKPLYMADTRTMPEDWEPTDEENMFGPLMTGHNMYKQVHARGRMDLIVYSENTGNFAIIDHKTTDKQLEDEIFAHTDLDEQCSTYIWAAELEAKLYDLPYKEIAGIVYQKIRKAFPRPPTILKAGTPSLNRQTESTTAQMFSDFIKEAGMTSLFEADEKMQAYYNYLVEKGDKQFIRRWPVTRNSTQKENTGLSIYMEAMDMLDNPRIYKNATERWSCTKCPFRAPCLAVEAGYDYKAMLEDGYEENFDR
jgi:PD-(D/E)XK nuclease superfamily